jgi:hypothetical protein
VWEKIIIYIITYIPFGGATGIFIPVIYIFTTLHILPLLRGVRIFILARYPLKLLELPSGTQLRATRYFWHQGRFLSQFLDVKSHQKHQKCICRAGKCFKTLPLSP